MIAHVWRRLQLMIAQGIGLRVSTHTVQIKCLDGEVLDNIDRIQPYGFSYRPHSGHQAYEVFPSGDRSHGFCLIAGDRRYTLELQDGEVALHDDQGQMVKIARDMVLAKSHQKIRLEAPDIEIVASERFAFQTNGHGQEWLPTKINTWQIGEEPGEAYPISPPEF
jgi:phage gp45-like